MRTTRWPRTQPGGTPAPVMPRLSMLALCMAGILLLPACGGGGGGAGYSGAMVRPNPPPPPPAPPPPPPAPVFDPAQPPSINTTGDVQITLVAGASQNRTNVSTLGSISVGGISDGAFVLGGTNRFDAGTTVSSGQLFLAGNLFSDVSVQQDARLSLYEANIVGDVLMAGTFKPVFDDIGDGGFDYYLSWGSEIWGDYTQTPTGTMAVALGVTKGVVAPLLDIHGVAHLQGTLAVDVDPVYVTSTPRAEWILRASGGVVGQFDRWINTGPLFITASLRYAPNDVFFDITRISAQAAMAASPFADAATLASAAHLDRAFEAADGFAGMSRDELNASQRQFLASAAAIQRIGDHAQAAATLDSLSGQAHASAQALLLDRAAAPAAQLRTRLDRLRPGMRAGAWTQRVDGGGNVAGNGSIGAGYDIDGRVGGFDQWLGNGWLLGASVGWSDSRMQFERQGGDARADTPMANVYLHRRGSNDTYVTGITGYGHTRLTLDRPLDLASAGRHHAHSERDVSLAYVHAETGRSFGVGGGRLTPFASGDWSALRSEGFVEQGNSGFELVAQPSGETRMSGGAGMRYLRDWRFGSEGWMQLDVSAQYRHVFARSGDPVHAAFAGAPMAGFQLDGLPFDDDHGVFGFGLAGGWRDAWRWFVLYDKAFTGDARGDAWSAGLRLAF